MNKRVRQAIADLEAELTVVGTYHVFGSGGSTTRWVPISPDAWHPAKLAGWLETHRIDDGDNGFVGNYVADIRHTGWEAHTAYYPPSNWEYSPKGVRLRDVVGLSDQGFARFLAAWLHEGYEGAAQAAADSLGYEHETAAQFVVRLNETDSQVSV